MQKPDRNRINQMIDDVVEDIMKQSDKRESDLDKALRLGTEMNKRVQDRLAPLIADWNLHPLRKPSRDTIFNIVQRLYLDDLAQNHLSKDEVVFLFTFNCAKILTDQIWTDV